MNDSDIDVPVLIVGGGAAGLTASVLLSRLGIGSLLVEARAAASSLPRAHVLNQRAMEILRDAGLADQVYAQSTPPGQMAYCGWYVGLPGAGPGHGRRVALMESWGAGGRSPEWLAASPERPANLPQSRLEPLLRARAEELAPGRVRFGQELTGFGQDQDGVSATIADRTREPAGGYRVRARYLLACDGGRTVGPALGIALRGTRDLARVVSFQLDADLSRWAGDPQVLIRWLALPQLGTAGVLVPMGPDRWGPHARQWVLHLQYPPDGGRAEDDEAVLADLRAALGRAAGAAVVRRISRWSVEGVLADRFRAGRVFLAGDAAHRHPPTGGLGLTSALADVQNLTWKLAARLTGRAGEELLDSYEAERRPTAALGVRRALAAASNQLAIAASFGFTPGAPPRENWRRAGRLWRRAPDGTAFRRAFLRTVAAQSMEFNELGVEFGYAYAAGALVPDGSPPPDNPDPVRLYQPAARPGHPLPHAWLEDPDGTRLALARLPRPGRLLLLAGEDGRTWCEAAAKLAARHALPLDAVRVGHLDGDYRDIRSSWTRWRGHGPAGAVLVRPDRFVAWRAAGPPPDGDPEAALTAAVDAVLSRPGRRAAGSAAPPRGPGEPAAPR